MAAKGPMVRVARERAPLYEGFATGLISPIQLDRLNDAWEDAWRNVPYYADLKQRLSIPERFGSTTEFSSCVPVLRKQDIQAHAKAFVRCDGKPDSWVMTGGSTGEPLRVGRWKNEGTTVGANHLIGRSWYGVVPGDKLFMIWGHSHMFGRGLRRLVKGGLRRVKDRVLSYYRCNAYYLDDQSLRDICKAYLHYRPDYVIGYSGALALLARHVAGKANFKPKVVIGCAEGFADSGIRRQVSEAFLAPVAMEYGSVECGCMAHEHPSGGYRVFWDTHLVEVERSPSGEMELLITKLTRCYTPLLRYRIGDTAELRKETCGPLDNFVQLSGRTSDYIRLSNGRKLDAGIIADAVLEVIPVLQFQVVKQYDCSIALRIRVEGAWDEAVEDAIRSRLSRISSELAALRIIRVQDVPKTAAGKVRWYVDESSPLREFADVTGRTDDVSSMPDGSLVHWAVIDDALCEIPEVLQFQLIRKGGIPASIRLRLEGELTRELRNRIRERLARVNSSLSTLAVVQVSDMQKTPAGKVRWYVDETGDTE